ncbi:Uncharacterised protein [Mycoplasmopsis maculosa]|uniref:Uncharacterized protein n=1 Tax=Mycoplasmopsis maculosa TaxID=114885 RepID=A0A449B4V1_9BACT|nr:hypothetical protein [Mycoplasmopsis maculosa]VEU75596.1 Uncharacterised protein [Mycoplasmopsis maculosa]
MLTLEKFKININEFKNNYYYGNEIKIPYQFKKINETINEIDFFNKESLNILIVCDLFINQVLTTLFNGDITSEEIENILGTIRLSNIKNAVYSELNYRLSNNYFPDFANKKSLINSSFVVNFDGQKYQNFNDLLSPKAISFLTRDNWEINELESENIATKLIDTFVNVKNKVEALNFDLKNNSILDKITSSKIESLDTKLSNNILSTANNLSNRINESEHSLRITLDSKITKNTSDIEKINSKLLEEYVLKESLENNINPIKQKNEEFNADIRIIKSLLPTIQRDLNQVSISKASVSDLASLNEEVTQKLNSNEFEGYKESIASQIGLLNGKDLVHTQSIEEIRANLTANSALDAQTVRNMNAIREDYNNKYESLVSFKSSATETLNDQISKTNTLITQIGSLNSWKPAVESITNSLESKFRSLSLQLNNSEDDFNSKITKNTSNINEINNKLSEDYVIRDTLDDEIDPIKEIIEVHKTDLGTIKSNIATIQSTLTSLQNQINQIKQNNSSSTNATTSLKWTEVNATTLNIAVGSSASLSIQKTPAFIKLEFTNSSNKKCYGSIFYSDKNDIDYKQTYTFGLCEEGYDGNWSSYTSIAFVNLYDNQIRFKHVGSLFNNSAQSYWKITGAWVTYLTV